MIEDPLVFLQSLLTKEFGRVAKSGGANAAHPSPLIITVTRDYGALGEEIAQRLAAVLQIPCFDQEIQELLAERAKIDKVEIARFDEQDPDLMSAFLYNLLSGSIATMEIYRHYLREVLDEVTRQDCLIIGRGAHLILRSKPVFRLRIVGSHVMCTHRIAAQEKLTVLAAGQKVVDVNHKRQKSIAAMFNEVHGHAGIEEAKNFDLIINTDHLTVEAAIPIILLALRQFGFDLSSSAAREAI